MSDKYDESASLVAAASRAQSKNHDRSTYGGSIGLGKSSVCALNNQGAVCEEGDMTMWGAVSSFTTTSIGAGILLLPKSAWQCGWLGSSFMLAFVAYLANDMSCTLADACFMAERSLGPLRRRLRSLEEIAEQCAGPKAKIAAGIIQNVTVFCIGVMFVGLIGNMLKGVMPEEIMSIRFGANAMAPELLQKEAARNCSLLMTVVWSFFILMRDMAIIGKLAIVGVIASFVTLIAIIIGGVIFAKGDHDARIGTDPEVAGNVWSIVASLQNFGKFAFSYGGVLVVPACRRDMKNDEDLKKASIIGHVITGGIYGLLSVSAIFLFGTQLTRISEEGTIVDVMTDTDGSYSYAAYAVMYSVIANVIVSLPLIINVLCLTSDDFIYKAFKETQQDLSARTRIITKVARVSIMLIAGALAVMTGKFFNTVVDVIATICLIPLCFWSPLWFYWSFIARTEGFGPGAKARPFKSFMHFAITLPLTVILYVYLIYGTYKRLTEDSA